MNTENPNTLREKYPELAGNLYFECGDGWYSVLDRYFQTIQEMALPEEGFGIYEVKQKYARLSISCWTYDLTDEQNDAISRVQSLAECRALVTCEFSGNPGSLYKLHGWLNIACAEESRGGILVKEYATEEHPLIEKFGDQTFRYERAVDDFVAVDPEIAPAP